MPFRLNGSTRIPSLSRQTELYAKPDPLPEINVRELATNPTVVAVMAALQHSKKTSHQLGDRVGKQQHELAPVLREMQRSRMIAAVKPAPGTQTVYYQIAQHAR